MSHYYRSSKARILSCALSMPLLASILITPSALAQFVQPDASFGANGSTSTGLLGSEGLFSSTSNPRQPITNLNLGQMAQTHNRIWVSGVSASGFVVQRYLPNGTADASFGTNGMVSTNFSRPAQASALTFQPDGKLVVVGYLPDQFSPAIAAARYDQAGVLDASFGSNGIVSGSFPLPSMRAKRVVVLNNGNILIGAVGQNGAHNFYVVRLLPNGQPDTSFNNGTAYASYSDDFQDMIKLSNGQVLLVGSEFSTMPLYESRVSVRRFTATGSLDASFGTNGRTIAKAQYLSSSGQPIETFTEAYGAAEQPDGKILLAGRKWVHRFSTGNVLALLRLNANGTPDAAFNTAAMNALTASGGLISAAVLADGKIVAGGSGNVYNTSGLQVFMTRLTAAGNLDPTFSAAAPNISAGHYFQTLSSGRGTVGSLLPQPTGQLLVLGGYETLNGMPEGIRLARYLFSQPSATRGSGAAALRLQATPVPASGVVQLRYQTPGQAPVKVRLHDQLGCLVASFAPVGPQTGGAQEYAFDTAPLANGLYVCTLEAGDLRQSIKLVVRH